MRRALCIAQREYLASVKTKGFLIGLLIAPLLMFGSGIAMVFLRHEVDVSDKRVAVLDRSGRLADALAQTAASRNAAEVVDAQTGKKVKPAYLLDPVTPVADQLPAQRLALSERIRRGELHAFVEIGPEIVQPGTNPANARITYHAKAAALDDLRRWLESPINNELRRLRLAEAGIEEARVTNLFRWHGVEAMGLVAAHGDTGEVEQARRSSEIEAVAVPLVSVVLTFMMVMMGASPLLGTVMEEKGLRVTEVLLGCATPFEMMLGKLLGSVGVALTGAAFYLGATAFVLLQLGAFGFFPLGLVPWFLLYVALAILMVGALSAALGSTCNDAKDAQNLALPALLPVILPMFILGPVLKEPHSTFAVWTSFVPPFTPMLMLLRQSSPGGVPFWQPLVGLAGMLLFAWVAVFAAARVFRIGLLMQGKAPGLGTILRWAIRG
jgi:ABC-2 type transport system permease protein